jgi:hypothetical protein
MKGCMKDFVEDSIKKIMYPKCRSETTACTSKGRLKEST